MTEEQAEATTPETAEAAPPSSKDFATMCRQMMHGDMPDCCGTQMGQLMRHSAAQPGVRETGEDERETEQDSPAVSCCH